MAGGHGNSKRWLSLALAVSLATTVGGCRGSRCARSCGMPGEGGVRPDLVPPAVINFSVRPESVPPSPPASIPSEGASTTVPMPNLTTTAAPTVTLASAQQPLPIPGPSENVNRQKLGLPQDASPTLSPPTNAPPPTAAAIETLPPSEIVDPQFGKQDPLPSPDLQDATLFKASAIIDVDLASALAQVTGANPQVNFAKARVQEAIGQLESAEVLWLPSINMGLNYNKHEGWIQDVKGHAIKTSRGDFYSGLGAWAVGAASPVIPGLVARFHLKDAVFQPRIAAAETAARRGASQAVTNDILMQTSLTYLNLLDAVQQRAIAEETLRHAKELADLTAEYARVGQGTLADADRALVELEIRRSNLVRTEEQIMVASSRLARLLNQDPTVLFVPEEPMMVPIDLVTVTSLKDLVIDGLMNRPELSESRALVNEAVQGFRKERYSPLVPSVMLGMSYGLFGAGIGSSLSPSGDRMDFDAVAYWEVRNLGLGEVAARDTARARVDTAEYNQVRVLDQVAQEVTEAYAQVETRKRQVAITRNAVSSGEASYRRNLARIRDGLGLPIEVLQSIQALDQVRREYLRAVTDYNEAQFRLERALGWPVPPTFQ